MEYNKLIENRFNEFKELLNKAGFEIANKKVLNEQITFKIKNQKDFFKCKNTSFITIHKNPYNNIVIGVYLDYSKDRGITLSSIDLKDIEIINKLKEHKEHFNKPIHEFL